MCQKSFSIENWHWWFVRYTFFFLAWHLQGYMREYVRTILMPDIFFITGSAFNCTGCKSDLKWNLAEFRDDQQRHEHSWIINLMTLIQNNKWCMMFFSTDLLRLRFEFTHLIWNDFLPQLWAGMNNSCQLFMTTHYHGDGRIEVKPAPADLTTIDPATWTHLFDNAAAAYRQKTFWFYIQM